MVTRRLVWGQKCAPASSVIEATGWLDSGGIYSPETIDNRLTLRGRFRAFIGGLSRPPSQVGKSLLGINLDFKTVAIDHSATSP